MAEIMQELDIGYFGFSATSIGLVRGILMTGHIQLKQKMSDKDIWKIYRDHYSDEPFIRIVKDKTGIYRYPEPKLLWGTNYCDIGFELDPGSNRLVVISAIDNLMKGAAGQAVQCMNLMFGIPETHWVAIFRAAPHLMRFFENGNGDMDMMIIKVGGGESINVEGIIKDLKRLGEKAVIVHGANHARDELMKKLGHEKKILLSLSGYSSVYSDDTAIDMIMMAYSGLRNKRIVELCQRNGVDAIGLSGIDGKMIQGKRNQGIRIKDGQKIKIIRDNSGKPDRINSGLLKMLLEQGLPSYTLHPHPR
jgi:hypothetical protein